MRNITSPSDLKLVQKELKIAQFWKAIKPVLIGPIVIPFAVNILVELVVTIARKVLPCRTNWMQNSPTQ